MPKISEERREERRRQILKAAIACYARKGFHATRVQDICRQADLSPGAVYLYFDGKEAIVRALAEQAQAESEALWARMDQSGDGSGLRTIENLIERICSESDATALRMNVQFWAQAFDNAFLSDAMLTDHEKSVERIVRLLRSEGEIALSDAKALAAMVLATFRGFSLQRAIVPTVDLKPAAHAFLRALRGALSGALEAAEMAKKAP